MKSRIEIKAYYTPKSYGFSSKAKTIHMPYLNVIVKNPETGETDKNTSQFLVDTGASVSIINSRYESFIQKIKPYDSFKIQYGNGGLKNCPMYHVAAIIKGIEFNISVAYDAECPFLLLGHFEFMERNSYTIFDSYSSRLQIIRL